jgi:hypothetical protein
MNMENLENMYNNLEITNGEDFWKFVILEHLINFEEKNIESLNITEEKIDNMVSNIMANDNLWDEIDCAVADAIEEETAEEIED